MRKLFTIMAAFGLAALLAAPASAAVVPFTGSISVVIAGLPGLPVPGAGTATINGSGGATKPLTAISIPGGVFATTVSVPLPNAFPIVGLVVSAGNGAAVFSSGASACGTAHSQVSCSNTGTLHGRAGLSGSVFVGLFGTATGPFANLTVPLGIVGGGSTLFVQSPLGISLMNQGAGWTSGTASILTPEGTLTVMGGQTNPGPNTGSVTLVTPLSVYTNATGGYLPSFAVWTVNFAKPAMTPEPGVLLLLGSGVMGLALYGRRRMRK